MLSGSAILGERLTRVGNDMRYKMLQVTDDLDMMVRMSSCCSFASFCITRRSLKLDCFAKQHLELSLVMSRLPVSHLSQFGLFLLTSSRLRLKSWKLVDADP